MDLFDAKDNLEIVVRIEKLQPEIKAQWERWMFRNACTRSGASAMCVRRAKLKKDRCLVTLQPHALKQMTSGKRGDTACRRIRIYHYGRTEIREERTAYCSCARFTQSGPGAITKDMHRSSANDSAAMERSPVEPFESPFVQLECRGNRRCSGENITINKL